MKYIIIILLFLGNSIFGQTKLLVSDTNSVRIYIGEHEIYPDTIPEVEYDTSYFVADKIIHAGDFVGYYDKQFSKKAFKRKINKNGETIEYSLWYRNGQIESEGKDTLLIKDFHFWKNADWFPDGKIKDKTIFKKDSLIYITYYDNGKVRDVMKEYLDTTLLRPLYCYHEERFKNGQLKYTPLDDNWYKKRQKVFMYFPNGKVRINGTMFFAEFISKYEEWNAKGVLIISGQYEDYPNLETEMKKAFRKPNKIGEWVYYNDKGEFLRKELYNDSGDIIKTIDK